MRLQSLSGLGMLFIRGSDYIPEPEVIYQMNQNWRKCMNLYLSDLGKYLYHIQCLNELGNLRLIGKDIFKEIHLETS